MRYPAVALLGPRQCGKTTLAQSLAGCYFDLEDDGDRLKLDLQWDELIPGRKLIVLDEAQVVPELFPRLRSAIDQDRKRNGRFLLLGSVAPALMSSISESLAGRLALVELSPFSLDEVGGTALDELWLYGGFPDGGILGTGTAPRWQLNYLALLAQRDLPGWGLPAKPQMTERLFRMLAAVQGAQWNASGLGKSLGLNYQTVNHYMDYLEGTFLLRRLQPYHANVKKRLVKSPKVYWRDTGLLHALMNVVTMDALLAQPWVGSSWEGFVIEQILICMATTGINFVPYYLRTSDQYEVDLVLDFGTECWAIEAKLTAHPSVDDMRRLNKVADMIGAQRRFLVSRTTTVSRTENAASLHLRAMLEQCRSVSF